MIKDASDAVLAALDMAERAFKQRDRYKAALEEIRNNACANGGDWAAGLATVALEMAEFEYKKEHP